MSDTPNRRASRRLPPRGKVRVICRKGGLDLGKNLVAGVLDVSETGIRLLLTEVLPVGQEATLTFESPASGRRVQRLANVVWCVPAEEGKVAAGFHFQKHLGYADLDHFARQ